MKRSILLFTILFSLFFGSIGVERIFSQDFNYGISVWLVRIRVKKDFDYDNTMEIYFIVKIKEMGREFATYGHIVNQARYPASGRWFEETSYSYWFGPRINVDMDYTPMQFDVIIEVWEEDYGGDDLIDSFSVSMIKGRKLTGERDSDTIWYEYEIDGKW